MNCMPSSNNNVNDSTPVKRNVTLTLPVKVYKHRYYAIIDTGAMENCLKESVCKRLKLKIKSPQPDQLKCARGATGEPIKILGYAEVPLWIEDLNIWVPMAVMPHLDDDMLLGISFFQENKATINFADSTMSLYNNEITIQLQPFANHEIIARVSKPCILQAQAHTIVPVSIPARIVEESKKTAQRHAMLSPVRQTGQFFVANAVVPMQEAVNCQILNNTDKIVKLKKGQRIAVVQPLRDTDISPWSEAPVPPNKVESKTLLPELAAVNKNNLQMQADQSVNAEAVKDKLDYRLRSIGELGIKLTNEALTQEQKQQLTDLIEEFNDIFALDVTELKDVKTNYYHTIHLKDPDTPPFRTRQYRHPPEAKKEITRQVNQWLEAGIIQKSHSPFTNPLVLVPKKAIPGKESVKRYRVCCDLRKLNALTQEIHWPLPTFDQVLDVIAAKPAHWYSVIDAVAGYMQIPIHPLSRQFLSFEHDYNSYSFCKMPFGLKCASSIYMAIMTDILGSRILSEFGQIYIDDLIVFSVTFEDHLSHLRQVFERLRTSGLKMSPEKSSFGQNKIKFLGLFISREGVSTDPDKVKAITEYPQPKNVSELRSFIGMATYLRKFIHNFSQLASPLHKLLQKEAKFVWSEQAEKAFQAIKEKLTIAPVLAYPDVNRPFQIFTDASYNGLGYVLTQKDENGRLRVISYGGRGISQAELRYSVSSLEALALITAVREYHYFISNVKVDVYTDHISLRYLQTMTSKAADGKMLRSALLLQPYNLEIHFTPGRSNKVADALSRRDWPEYIENEVMPKLHDSIRIDRVKAFGQLLTVSTIEKKSERTYTDVVETERERVDEVIQVTPVLEGNPITSQQIDTSQIDSQESIQANTIN